MNNRKALITAIGSLTAASFSLGALADSNDNPFAYEDLGDGYMVAGEEGECGEGKCGEGKCGEGKDKDKEGEGKCGEGKCGEDKDKEGEGNCGEEGSCGVA